MEAEKIMAMISNGGTVKMSCSVQVKKAGPLRLKRRERGGGERERDLANSFKLFLFYSFPLPIPIPSPSSLSFTSRRSPWECSRPLPRRWARRSPCAP